MPIGDVINNLISKEGKHLPTFNELKLQGWSIIATNPNNIISSQSVASTSPLANGTFKTQHISAADVSQIALMFGNWCNIQPNQSIQPNYQALLVGSALQKQGSSVSDDTGLFIPVYFKNGGSKLTLDPEAHVVTEGAFFPIKKNERFYIRTYISTAQPAAPAAPILSTGNGTINGSTGSLVNGATYNVCLTYVYQDGLQSATSAGVGILVGGTSANGYITVTAPSSTGGAIGYKIWMTSRTDTQTGLYKPASGVIPFGTDTTLYAEPHVNCYRYVRQGGAMFAPVGGGMLGGTNFDGQDTGEGMMTGDFTLPFSLNTNFKQSSYTNYYSPIAILGKTTTPVKSVALIGDSIQAGTGDCGLNYASGGFGVRAITNQLQPKIDITQNPYFGYVRVPLGGEQAAQFAPTLSSNQYFRGRLAVTQLATNVICNYGTNDLVNGLSTLQNNILAIAKWYIQQGIKFFQCTLFPRTNSTDGFQTVVNQTTQGATEITRVNFNNWLRDSTASGFIAQVSALTGVSSMAGIIDVCKYSEVDSTGTITLNGGLWRIPAGMTPVTGTLTTVSTAYDFTDSSKTWIRNVYKGWDFIITSGGQINKRYNIGYNTAAGNVNTYNNTIGGTPSVGDSYKITLLPTVDGIHPSAQGHIWGAMAVQEVFDQLI